MDQNLYDLAVKGSWFSSRFEGLPVAFDMDTPKEATWELQRKISERCIQRWNPCEAIGVFEVVQTSGPNVGSQAILKIRMQVPRRNSNAMSEDPGVRAKIATQDPLRFGPREVWCLIKLTSSNCSVSPKLLYHGEFLQDESMWVPGGYLHVILMEKLPGRTPLDFWEWPRNKRDELRKAFLTSFYELIRSGLEPSDQGLRNLLWDDKNKKCYIIDYEECSENEISLDSDGKIFDELGYLARWEMVIYETEYEYKL